MVAEWLAGELARAAGLRVPELVFVDVDPALGDSEPDIEIHDLVQRSGGLNVGLDFLPGALPFSPAAAPVVDAAFAADTVWVDGLLTNPDRTVANPNMLVWHRNMWLIDHGAALYVHHAWRDPDAHARQPFERLRDRVLLPFAGSILEADERLGGTIGADLIDDLVTVIPELWLPTDPVIGDADRQRDAYRRYLALRLTPPRPFVEEAERARRRA
ncbi:MAG: HipA family kinase [Candidatus Limnocylindrales bacterium]